MAIVGYIFIAFGVVVYLFAKSAIHEIEAFILFLIAAVLISGAKIIEAVNSSHPQGAQPQDPGDVPASRGRP